MIKVTCTGCNAENVKSIGPIPSAITFAGGTLNAPIMGGVLYRCSNCKLAFRFPQLSKHDLDMLYQSEDNTSWHSSPSSRRVDWDLVACEIATIENANCDILDIGCFDGGFLHSLVKGFGLFGVEMHPGASELAVSKGVTIVGSDFDSMDEVDRKFGVTTSFDSIEHSRNPAVFLKDMAKLTMPGGLVILSTGNADAPTWKLLGGRYWYCTISEHISFISPKWCDAVADQLGLSVEKIIRYSHSNAKMQNRVAEFLINVIYALSPKFFSMLRKWGFGGAEFRIDPCLNEHPPSWMTAKDHFICVFKKNEK